MSHLPSIEILKSHISLSAVIGDIVELKNGKGLCPFHADRNPSLSIKGERWRCWSCGEGGDIIDWIKKFHGIDTSTAIKILADRAGIKPGTMTPSERAAMQSERSKRERRAALKERYKQWIFEYEKETALCLRTLRRVKARWSDFSRAGLERLAAIQTEIDYAEYFYAEVFCEKNEVERLSLYKRRTG